MNPCNWVNWAGSLSASVSDCYQPKTAADVQAIILANHGKKVRPVGTSHSWSPLLYSGLVVDSVLIDMSGVTDGNGTKARRWQRMCPKTNTLLNLVTIFPAATWADVRAALTDPAVNLPEMYMSTSGVLPSINATGFLAVGGHGTGWMQPSLSQLVYEIELVAADGQLHVFSEHATPDLMDIVRVSVGMLGIITKITVKVDLMYLLRDQEYMVDAVEVMGPNPNDNQGQVDPTALSALVTGNQYVEVIWFPWSGFFRESFKGHLSDGEIWVKQWNRTTDPETQPPSLPSNWQDAVVSRLMEFVAEWPVTDGGLPFEVHNRERKMWRAIARQIDRCPPAGFVAKAPLVLHYQDFFPPVLALEVAVPIPADGPNSWNFANIVKAWYQVVNLVRDACDRNSFPLTFCMNARFTKNSQCLLSPDYEPAGSRTHYCWFEILSAYPKQVADAETRAAMVADFGALVGQLGQTLLYGMNGRPHWAKYWQTIPQALAKVSSFYPAANLSQFNALRKTLDPDDMFMNPFLESLNLFSP
jgi:hypothetical protein